MCSSDLTVLAAGDNPIEGKVRLVSTEIDRVSRMGKARVIAGRDRSLRIGAFARGEIETQRRHALSIPASAALYDAQGAYAQTVRDGKVATKRIKVGLVAGGMAEILEGLAEGDDVILRAGAFLNDGDAVEARRAAAPATSQPGRERVGSR